jgi:transcriptional regulator with XRE-family HTH domain
MRPLATKLTAARNAKGMSVSDVARLMPEVARSTVGHWFTGERQPQMDNLKRLAEILEVSAAALVADEPDYASTAEEKIGLQLMRQMTPEQRQAMLALMKSMSGDG